MQCVLDRCTDTLERDMVGVNTDMRSTDTAAMSASAVDDAYATLPMAVMFQSSNEEELYSAFEDAISGRISSIQARLHSISNAQLHTQQRACGTNAIIPAQAVNTGGEPGVDFATEPTMASLQPPRVISWQNRLMHACLALIFIMLGFDLMGLLALHVR